MRIDTTGVDSVGAEVATGPVGGGSGSEEPRHRRAHRRLRLRSAEQLAVVQAKPPIVGARPFRQVEAHLQLKRKP